MRVAFVFVSVLMASAAAGAALALGCSSSSSPPGGGASDAGNESCAPIDSACGQPCDPGNSLGIGRFCNNLTDCHGTQVPTLCATFGDPSEHFCSAVCVPPDASDEAGFLKDCGENATCACQGGQCGCTPTSCQ